MGNDITILFAYACLSYLYACDITGLAEHRGLGGCSPPTFFAEQQKRKSWIICISSLSVQSAPHSKFRSIRPV